jgi:hypothetical protein
MPSVLITGGTGLVGTAVKSLLESKGYEVILLTRSKTSIKGQAHWDINAGTIDSAAIAAADYIIHLAGAGVADKRWSKARKQEILDSRTKSSALLVKALTALANRTSFGKVLISFLRLRCASVSRISFLRTSSIFSASELAIASAVGTSIEFLTWSAIVLTTASSISTVFTSLILISLQFN